MFFVLWMSFGQNAFSIQKSKFYKIQILVFGENDKTQKCFKMFVICDKIFITCLYFNTKWENYFCVIFTSFMDLLKYIFNMCFCPKFVADRPGRPTARVDRTKGRSTLAVDRRAQACAHLSDTGPVGRSTDRIREPCSLYLGDRPGGQPDWPNGHIYDRWRSTGPVDRKPVRLPDQTNG